MECDTMSKKPQKSCSSKPPIPVGTDVAFNLSGLDDRKSQMSYWDLWFLLVTADGFSNDLDQLAQHFRKERKGHFGKEDAKRKLSHLRDLQQRLMTVEILPETVLKTVNPTLLNAEKRRAPGRILKHNERVHERSYAMRHLPEERLYRQASHGQWPHFPISPESFAERFRQRFRWNTFYGENASHGLASKLDAETARAQKLLDKSEIVKAQAMLRSLLTVAIELIEIADDSYGAIGDSFQEAFQLYLEIPHQKTGIATEIYWADLLEFLIWEDYGFTDDQTDGYFAKLTTAETDFCLDFLCTRITALQAIDLDYQAEAALTLKGQIVAEQKRFDLFETLAAEMGSRAWRRIILLVDVAHKANKLDLAVAVFKTAMTDGSHKNFLQKKYEQLKKGNWNPDPRK